MKKIEAVIIDTYPDRVTPWLAIRRTLALANIARLHLFSDEPFVPGAEFHRIPRIRSLHDYNDIVLRRLPDIVRESHCLVIQWDGMPVDPARWDDAFLEFDYVGAPWVGLPDSVAVGNGGFSLRSRRLLDAIGTAGIRADPLGRADQAEDVLIGQVHRVALEAAGVRFAPVQTAGRFSYESGRPPAAVFGFHSSYNFPWFLPERELVPLADHIVARQSNMRILLLYLHNLLRSNMQELFRLTVAAVQARPSLAPGIEREVATLPVDRRVLDALSSPAV